MTFSKGQSSGRGRAFQSSAIGKPERAPKPPGAGLTRTTPLKQSTGPKRSSGGGMRRKPGGPDAAAAWRAEAFERVVSRYGRLVDEVTGENLSTIDAQVHHVLEAGDLFTQGPQAVALAIWSPANSMVLHKRTHERHHSRQAPIPRSRLRIATLDLADELDALDAKGRQWWAARIATDYGEEAT